MFYFFSKKIAIATLLWIVLMKTISFRKIGKFSDDCQKSRIYSALHIAKQIEIHSPAAPRVLICKHYLWPFAPFVAKKFGVEQ